MFRPTASQQMTTPCMLQVPELKTVLGVEKKTYKDAEQFICNWKSYGGTEIANNGVLTIEDTATVTTWFNPHISANCRVKRLIDGAVYEIIGEPENIELRNMIMQFKAKRISGGA